MPSNVMCDRIEITYFICHAHSQTGNPNDNMPPELTRRYEVVVRPQTKQRALKLREINADHIGRLVTVQVRI